jgi:iron complex outermembrane recepter protein
MNGNAQSSHKHLRSTGLFCLSKPRRLRMFKKTQISTAAVFIVAGGAMLAPLAQAQQQPQRIEITGSSIKRIDGETAAPVQILKREDIEKTGATSVEQLMRSVSSMVSSQATVAASSSGATSGGISTISLRGLTAERTLVLINGKRVAPYGQPDSSVSVDVDSIPIAAIERVEILKDGASAIYGSDAIAGVVNFVLRKDFTGVDLNVGYGAATQDGKGKVAKASIVAGFGDLAADRFNVMGVLTLQKDGALFGRDRDFARTSIRLDRDNFGGSSRTSPGNITIPDVDGVFNPLVNGAAGTGNCAPDGAYVPDFSRNICLFDTGPYVGLIPKTERVGVFLTGRFNVNQALELYADVGLTKKKAKTVIQPSPIDVAFGIPFRLTTDSPFYPTAFVQAQTGGATPRINVRYRPFIIGNRELTDDATATRFNFGATGTVAGWEYDANVLHSTSQVVETLQGGYFRVATDASGPGIVPLLAGEVTSGGQRLWVNPFGPNTPEVIAAARATNFLGQAFKTQTALTSLNGKASRELAKLDGGALAIAIGTELRRESFKLDSAEALGSGNISGYGGNFVDIDTKRNMTGLFAELSAPLVKGLQIDGAVRFDRYAASSNPLNAGVAQTSLGALVSVPTEDPLPASLISRVASESVGNAPAFSKATGKMGLRYQVVPELLLRGTLSTGFRAPSLLDLYGPIQAGVSAVQNDPLRCRGADAGNPDFCATQFNVYNGGNSRLKAETSTNFTVGFVAEPTRGFSVGVDYFNTQVKNLISTTTESYLLENESRFPGRVTRGAANEIIAIDQRLENTGRVKLSGFDFDVRGRMTTDVGKLGAGWSATYMSTWKSQNPDGSFENGLATTDLNITGFIPRMRHTISLTWDVPNWSAGLQYNWQSGGTDVCGNLLQDDFGNCPPGSNPKFGAYETTDVQLKYSGLMKGLGLTVGIRNLFDKTPPYVNGAGGAFQAGYDPTYVDPRGRFLYFNIGYKF